MRYHGGKGRHAKHIESTIVPMAQGREKYLEPFVGGGSVLSRLAPHFPQAIASDNLECLINFWNAVVFDGWRPPVTISKEQYLSLKLSDEPTPMKAWAGFAASYNGKWFAGYGPKANGIHKHDYLVEASNSLARKIGTLLDHQGLQFRCADYREMSSLVDRDTVVYCDPPYEGTCGYGNGAPFDSDKFWDTVEQWRSTGALVLVHEFIAPESWNVVYRKERVSTMDYGGSALRRDECLFM